MKAQLPALALRTTRTRLLASSYEDALTSGTLEGRSEKPGSRMNLHDDLWTQGSYDELEQVLSQARRAFRDCLGVAFKDQAFRYDTHRDGKQTLAADVAGEALQAVANMLPRFIYVPSEVSENAGYLPGDAGAWRMPEREQRRRWARLPAKT